MRRTTVLAALVVAVLAALTVSVPATAAPDPRADEHRRIVEYWTPERRASAVPRDAVRPGGPPDAKARPGGGGGGGGDTTTITGATWTAMDAPVAKLVGKVFFTENGTRYTCSGSAVAGGGVNLVLTAGHCVHGGPGGAFATNWIFYPQYGANPADPPLGEWTATALFTTAKWSGGTASTKWDDDAGFAVVTDGTGASLAGEIGVAPPTITFTEQAPKDVQTSFGYPASKKYNGRVLTYCAGETRLRWDGANTYSMACDMTGGSSGGPWYTGFTAGGGGTVTSLNSYGYASVKNRMFGPIFDSGEETAYAQTADGECDSGELCSPQPAG